MVPDLPGRLSGAPGSPRSAVLDVELLKAQAGQEIGTHLGGHRGGEQAESPPLAPLQS